jgi:hypothetical protein
MSKLKMFWTLFNTKTKAESVAYPRIFSRGGVGGSTNSVQDRGQREWGSGGGSPLVKRVPLFLQMNETHILIRLLQMYIPQNREFGSALAKLRNLGGGSSPPPFGMPLARINALCVIFTYILQLSNQMTGHKK